MSTHEEIFDDIDTPPVGVSQNGAASFVDLIKQDMAELAASEEVYIRVQGYDGSGLQIKYRLPESAKELGSVQDKVLRTFKDTFSRNLYVAIDTMIALCEGLYVQPSGVEEPVMLDMEELGYPCKFDERLAKYLNMDEAGSARVVVRRLFNKNDFAIISHAEKLSRWLANTKADLDIEFWQLSGNQ